jgi:hypothetical protein
MPPQAESTLENPGSQSSNPDAGPPLGDFREAFSAIDDIPSIGGDDSGSRQSEPNRDTPAPKDKPAKPATEQQRQEPAKDKPAKRSLGEDIEGVLKPKEQPKQGDQKPAQSGEDPDRLFESPETPKRLRETYKATKAELEKTSSRVKELEASVERAKAEASESVRKDYETRLAASEKRRAELDTELRFLDYQRSEDYNSKYHTPLRDAWKETMSAVNGMTITDAEGNEREVAPHDIAALLTMANPAARKAAERMFGTAAPEIMTYRQKLMGLTTAREKALEEWKVKGSERDEQVAKERQEIVKRWESDIDGYREDHPELFGDREGDEGGNQLIRSGLKLARTAFLAEGVPDGLTTTQRREAVLNAQSQLTVRAMAFPRVLRDLKSAEAEIESLRTRLAEYESTELEPGNRRQGESESGRGKRDLSPEEQIDALPGVRF